MAIINGTSSSETVNGTTSDDTINGLGGSDTLIGDLGDDTYEYSGIFSTTTLYPYTDIVTELAGSGSDTIHILTGSNPGDIPASAVRVQGGSASDPNALWIIADGYGKIYLGNQLTAANVESLKIGNNAPISLTSGINMTGSSSGETINGSAFNDTINGMGGSDTLIGGLGDDTYEYSGIFSTTTLYPYTDIVTELAGSGSDTIHILTGSNPGDIPASAVRVQGGSTSDPNSLWIIADGYGKIYLGNQLTAANVESLKIGNNAPISLEWLQIATGTSISLTSGLPMTGNINIQTISGSAYNDIINGKGGNDTLIGNLGNDTYIIGNAGVTITEKLNEGTDTVKSSISYILPANVENLTLTGTLAINGTGNGSNNKLTGNSAANQLKGNGGNDTLDGKAGNNTLTGGAGQDTFKLTSAGHIDAITDFIAADDTIQLENAVFTALTTPGTLAAGQLKIGTQALDANDFVVYNNVTGALLYDADASGAAAAVQIATLSAGLALTNADFVVI
ncbi:hemolysin type calcium-binding protein [Nitrosomonas sp. Nm84]|uniref:calcium-binding protein n=1 Tax=Nitrosomonas sp. Nm84 TaxID=200124 RepID=UPI000D76C3D6|nr:calcium-binding protein [Nitrosomonas sp. Nm84]PXW88236.1 hemolysin type calcium-binding protein [Nitrosomonas sp. Nm84]